MNPLEHAPSKPLPFRDFAHNYKIDEKDSRSVAKYSETIKVHNCSDKKLMIRRRDGRIVPILPNTISSNAAPAIVVRVTMSIAAADRSDMIAALREIDTARVCDFTEVTKVLQILETHEHNSSLAVNMWQSMVDFDYIIPLEDVENAGGAIYVPEVDMMVQLTGDPSKVYHHPFSKEVAYLQNVAKLTNNRSTNVDFERSGGLFYYIIDNFDVFGVRYASVDGVVVKIPTMKDPIKPDGVYRVHSNRCTTSMNIKTIEEHQPFDRADDLFKIFKHYQTALNYDANEKAEIEMRNKELELELNLQKEQTAQLKANHDREMLDFKQTYEREKHLLEMSRLQADRADKDITMANARESERLAMERSRLKDDIDRKQMLRKDLSDNWKFILTVFMGMLTVGLPFGKGRKAGDANQK